MGGVHLFFCFSFSALLSTNAVLVDPRYTSVEWQGWGTSVAYFGDAIGRMDESIQNEIYSALFSPDKLNLNIIRYVIGGTTPGDESCGPYVQGANTESFRDGNNRIYDWTRDPHSRKVVHAAKNLGADTFEAFSMSPPSWLTKSGCTKGTETGAPLHDNLDPKNAFAFADYLTEVVKHYHEHFNISFTSLAPFTKPSSGIFTGPQGIYNIEGCNMELSTMVQVIKGISASLSAKQLGFCSLAVTDEQNVDEELQTQQFFNNSGVFSLYKKINSHGIIGDSLAKAEELASMAKNSGKVIWQSDWSIKATDLVDMSQALLVAENVVTTLHRLNPVAWVYWETVRDSNDDNWGLVNVPYGNASMQNIRFNSGYYGLMNFSKYIRKGYKLIHTNDSTTVVAYRRRTSTLVIVTVNSVPDTISKTFELHFPSVGEAVAFRTSAEEPHVAVPPPNIVQNQFTFDYPPRSVTTVKITGVF